MNWCPAKPSCNDSRNNEMYACSQERTATNQVLTLVWGLSQHRFKMRFAHLDEGPVTAQVPKRFAHLDEAHRPETRRHYAQIFVPDLSEGSVDGTATADEAHIASSLEAGCAPLTTGQQGECE